MGWERWRIGGLSTRRKAECSGAVRRVLINGHRDLAPSFSRLPSCRIRGGRGMMVCCIERV